MVFEDWWEMVIATLDEPLLIKNWTAKTRENIGEFVACSLRSLPDNQRRGLYGYPFPEPDNWIVCNQVRGPGMISIVKRLSRERYDSWPSYRDERRGFIRKDFDASPYVISIFHAFDKYMRVDDPDAVSAIKDYLAAKKNTVTIPQH